MSGTTMFGGETGVTGGLSSGRSPQSFTSIMSDTPSDASNNPVMPIDGHQVKQIIIQSLTNAFNGLFAPYDPSNTLKFPLRNSFEFRRKLVFQTIISSYNEFMSGTGGGPNPHDSDIMNTLPPEQPTDNNQIPKTQHLDERANYLFAPWIAIYEWTFATNAAL